MPGDIFKTFAFFSDYDQGNPHLIDTVSHLGRWWLVGGWHQSHATGDRLPATLVLLDGLTHQQVQGQPYRFLLTNAIPKSVLDGQAQDGYEVLNFSEPNNTPTPDSTNLN
jgi:hypothetical protein